MKTHRPFLFLAAILAASLGLAGCHQAVDAASSADDLAAQEVADSLANADNGLTTELDDQSSLAVTASAPAAATSRTVSFTVNGVLSGWTWNASSLRYERSQSSLTVTTASYSGTVGYSAWIAFYTTTDGSGTAVPLPDVTQTLTATANASIHSYRYHRSYTGTLLNTNRGMTRTIDAETNWTVTAVNDGDGIMSVSGSRVETVSGSSSRYNGNWTVTTTLNGLQVSRTVTGSTSVTSHQGAATIEVAGTWTGPRGTRTVDKTSTVTFNRQTTVQVTVDGSTVTVNLTTGQVD